MRIAIFSDIHDHLNSLGAALDAINEEAVDVLLCCGDLCSPFVLNMMGKRFEGPIHIVFGNNDGDTFRLSKLAQQWTDRVHLYGEMADFNLEGKRFALNHYPEIAEQVAAAGNFDVVCYGHDHQRKVNRFNTRGHEVILVNPGTLMGYRFEEGEPVSVTRSFAILDLEDDNEVMFWEVHYDPEQGWGATEISEGRRER